MAAFNYKKILIIRIGAIGDVVHTSMAYHAIKEANPNVEIHYLTTIDKRLLENDLAISKVWSIDYKFKPFSKGTFEFAKQLKSENFDAVINLQPSFKTRFLCFLAGIKRQYCYKKNDKIHAVDNYWETAKKAFPNIKRYPNLHLTLAQNTCTQMKKVVEQYFHPLIIFNAGHIFAKRQGRTYPIEKWIELGNKIQAKYDGTIIITGVKEDEEMLKPLGKVPHTVSFVNKLTLEENSALIKNCDLLISGDSGPLHIANALGVKTIGLFGSMPAKRTGIYSNGEIIISKKECVPCNHRKCKYLRGSDDLYAPCMKMITTDEIMEKVSLQLAQGEN